MRFQTGVILTIGISNLIVAFFAALGRNRNNFLVALASALPFVALLMIPAIASEFPWLFEIVGWALSPVVNLAAGFQTGSAKTRHPSGVQPGAATSRYCCGSGRCYRR